MNMFEQAHKDRLWIKHNLLDHLECAQCGSRKNLEFNHENPITKNFNIFEYDNNKTLLDRLGELLTCFVLCKSCHDKETRRQAIEASQQPGWIPKINRAVDIRERTKKLRQIRNRKNKLAN